MIKFYKEAATDNWVCGVKRKIAAGTCTMEANEDNSYIEIKENGLDKTIAEGPVSSFVDETGTPYSSFEALDNATKDFFVKASTGGGGIDSISKRVITHSDGGTINVETFVGKVEVSSGYGYGYGYEGSIMIGEW